jgi:hypothetical protein
MKRLIVIFVIIFLVVLISCKQGTSFKAGEVNAKIDSARIEFKNNNVAKGLDILLDAVLAVLHYTDFPAEVETKIFSAKESFKEGILNKEGAKALREALALINADTEEPEPASGNMGEVAEAFNQMLKSAQEELEEENPARAVKMLLEGVLLILGPAVS